MPKREWPWPEKRAEPIPEGETTESWQRRIFRHFDCEDAHGDWEILAYAMLLELRPDLISADPPLAGAAPRGRPRSWDASRLAALLESVERIKADRGWNGHGGDSQAVRALQRAPEFQARFGDVEFKTILTRLSEARRPTEA